MTQPPTSSHDADSLGIEDFDANSACSAQETTARESVFQEYMAQEDTAHEGIVLRAYNGAYIVQPAGDKDSRPTQIRCELRGNLKKDFTFSTSGSQPRRVTRAKRPFTYDVVAVGDRVRFTPIDAENGVIEEILPRTHPLCPLVLSGPRTDPCHQSGPACDRVRLRRTQPRLVAH